MDRSRLAGENSGAVNPVGWGSLETQQVPVQQWPCCQLEKGLRVPHRPLSWAGVVRGLPPSGRMSDSHGSCQGSAVVAPDPLLRHHRPLAPYAFLPEPRTGSWRHRAQLHLDASVCTSYKWTILLVTAVTKTRHLPHIQHYDLPHGPHGNLTNCPLVSYSLFLPSRAQDPAGHLPRGALQAPDGHSLHSAGPDSSASLAAGVSSNL